MNRVFTATLLMLAGLSVAACGSTGSAAPAKASPSPSPRARNGAAGELVKMTAMELILSSTAGDVVVDYTDTTTFQRSSTGKLADITVGACIVATVVSDATGALTVSGVRLSTKVNGACAAPRGPGGPGGGGSGPTTARTPRPSPSPGATPRPNFTVVSGEVTGVSGTDVQLKDSAGAARTATVPTTVPVSKSAAASATELALHECLQAQGPRDSAGKVTARSITIVPASATGCTFGPGGFGGGRFGGGGRGQGAGAGAAGGPPGG